MSAPDHLPLIDLWPSLARVVLRDCDLREDRIRWHGEVARYFGCRASDLPGSHDAFLERVHPDDRERVARSIDEARSSDEGRWSCDFRFRRDDGGWIEVRERGRVVRGASGRPTRALAALRPGPSGARLEEALDEKSAALRERGKELRTLYRMSRILLADADLDEIGRRLVELLPSGWQYASVAAARIVLGDRTFRSEGFRETPWMQRAEIPGDEGPLGRIEVAYTEERPRHDDGPFLREEASLLEEVAKRLGDAVRRRRAEEEQERSERHFRRLAEHATDVITVLAPDGTIRYESPSVERVLGHRPEDLVGRNAFDLIHPDDRSEVQEKFGAMIEGEDAIESLEYRFRHRDGAWRWLESVGRGRPASSDLEGVLVHSRDVTERKELEARLLEARRLEAVGRLASGIAHDFNNLLTVIRGNTDLLAAGLRSDDGRDEIDEILTASRRAAALTRDLLAFGRQENLDIRSVEVDEVVAALRPVVEERLRDDVGFELDVSPELDRVRMDPILAREALEELVDNAQEAMPGGGRLRIEVRGEEVVPGSPAARDGVGRGRWVVFAVSDAGAGMPEGHVERAVEPFFSTKDGHSGLGLSSVFGLVKQTGGEMRIRSTPGEGTTVEIYLPLGDEPPQDGGASPERGDDGPREGGEPPPEAGDS